MSTVCRRRSFPLLGLLAASGAAVFVAACAGDGDADDASSAAPVTTPGSASPDATAGADEPALENLMLVAGDVWSGGEPKSEASFDELQTLGIRTIISVDGARPNIEAAEARGMRYVHLPIGYDGINEETALTLGRAMRDLPHPIYVHCHHGKHRGPAAAAMGLVKLGELESQDGVEFMRKAGTSPNYPGLYSCVSNAYYVAPTVLDNAPDEFPSIATVSGMVASMAAIDRATEHLKLFEKNGWKAPANHPDLVAPAEAGRLTDLLRALHDDPDTLKESDEFKTLLTASAEAATEFEAALGRGGTPQAEFEALIASCKACHVKYRN